LLLQEVEWRFASIFVTEHIPRSYTDDGTGAHWQWLKMERWIGNQRASQDERAVRLSLPFIEVMCAWRTVWRCQSFDLDSEWVNRDWRVTGRDAFPAVLRMDWEPGLRAATKRRDACYSTYLHSLFWAALEFRQIWNCPRTTR
jgi:hypothetical protein